MGNTWECACLNADRNSRLIALNADVCLCVCHQAGVVVKVDFTKEVLKKRRLVSAATSERFTVARAGMTGKEIGTRYLLHRCLQVNPKW